MSTLCFGSSQAHLLPLSKEKHTLVLSNRFTSSHVSFIDRPGNTIQTFFSLFLSSNMERPLCLTSHNISCYLPSPHSLLALNDTVYTHPASIIPFHTSPGLFICLGCWGDMKAHSLLLRSRSHLPPLCLPSLSSPPATSAGCLWPLIYEGLLNPGGPV